MRKKTFGGEEGGCVQPAERISQANVTNACARKRRREGRGRGRKPVSGSEEDLWDGMGNTEEISEKRCCTGAAIYDRRLQSGQLLQVQRISYMVTRVILARGISTALSQVRSGKFRPNTRNVVYGRVSIEGRMVDV